MKKLILFSLAWLTGITAASASERVVSPDGKIDVEVDVKDGVPVYQVTYDGVTVVSQSALGLVTNLGDFSRDMQLKESKSRQVTGSYALRNIKQSQVSYEENELVACFEQKGQHVMDIIFRVSNRDVAFSYRLLPVKVRRDEARCCIIQEERTSFQLASETTSFLAPQSKPMTGFARTAPSYETTYGIDQPVGKNGWGNGYTFPCLFKVKEEQIPQNTKKTRGSRQSQSSECSVAAHL